MVWLKDGSTQCVDDIEIVELPEGEYVAVYNFEVADFHTYFVSDFDVLVHNDCKFENKNIKQNNSLFNPNYVDSKGRSNVMRMKAGLAPIGKDGKSINLHHIDQTDTGDLIEMTATYHQKNYSKLHSNTGQEPSKINRKEFRKFRERYWKNRSNDFSSSKIKAKATKVRK